MKNYLLSFFYCILYLLITVVGFWSVSALLDPQTYQIVIHTSLFFCLGMAFFLCIWFRQDELFFLLFLTLLTYLFLGYFDSNTSISGYYYHIAFPLMCLLYPINVYILLQIAPNDSFIYSFLKSFFILLCEVTLIYFFTYFVPVLFGTPFLLLFETQVGTLLNFSFGLTEATFTLPVLSLFVFFVCFALLVKRTPNKVEQIQAAIITLFLITFISFYFVSHPTFFHLCFLGGVASALFSLLQVSHKMAFLDELTGIPGRRALMTELKKLENEDFTLAMLDIDFFKRLNDSYGHEVGDQALRMITAAISEHSCGGTLYRYGGEEFVLLFPHRFLDEVLDALESARAMISNSDFFLRPKSVDSKKEANQPYLASVKITLSAGVAQKQDLQSSDDVMNIADQALYKAKQTGRNKTVYNKNGRFFELF